ncbi:MAG: hypothetical protein OXH22_07920 [Chloroflexi bacterium]|nr:hypothetical protein [Chloroflexota bacterium]
MELILSNLFGVTFVTLKLLVPLIAGIIIVRRGHQESNSLVWAIGMATIGIGAAIAFA